MIYTLYKLSDGTAVSNSREPIVNPDEFIYGVKETQGRDGVWDTAEQKYVIPAIRNIPVNVFLDRFTPTELESLYSKKDAVSNIGLFFYKIPLYSRIELDADVWQVAVNWLETNRHIDAGRATEILADG